MTRLFDINAGQQHQLLLTLQNEGFTLEHALRVIADPSKVALMLDVLQPVTLVRNFDQYKPFLHSLDEQKALLVQLNARLPKAERFPAAWVESLDTTSDHEQSVEDLEFFFVVLRTLEKTWNFNQKLVELTQAIYDSHFKRDASNMRLDQTAQVYEPGIHRVRINLVDNWSPEDGRAVDGVRQHSVAVGQKLAAVEAIGAYALQKPELYQSQDGENLPYFDCAGLQQSAANGFRSVPFSSWSEVGREVGFHSCGSDSVGRGYAAPSLLQGVQN